DDWEAAALVDAGVVDDSSPECLDQHVQVTIARVLFVYPQPVHGTNDVATVEGADAEVGQWSRDPLAQGVEPDLLDQQPQEVLVRDPLLVAQPLVAKVGVDLLPIVAVGVQPLLAL